MPGEELVHQALEVRRQVLDDDEGRLGQDGEVIEEAFERVEPAGGGADSHDVKAAHGARVVGRSRRRGRRGRSLALWARRR